MVHIKKRSIHNLGRIHIEPATVFSCREVSDIEIHPLYLGSRNQWNFDGDSVQCTQIRDPKERIQAHFV